jgi:hypothetical protein
MDGEGAFSGTATKTSGLERSGFKRSGDYKGPASKGPVYERSGIQNVRRCAKNM